MGIESFVAAVESCGGGSLEQIDRVLAGYQTQLASSEPHFAVKSFSIDVGVALIECEVRMRSNRTIKATFRFALCQPNAADALFVQMVRQVADSCESRIIVMEDVSPSLCARLDVAVGKDLDKSLLDAIGECRAKWDGQFGGLRMKDSVADAVKQFLMSR